jgi:hypothetical protein
MPGENDEIKSALEIALQKAERLGPLSAEEQKRAKEEELAQSGAALAKRYLNGAPLRDIERDLAKASDDERSLVNHHLLSHLLEAMGLDQPGQNEKALAAIEYLHARHDLVQGIRDLLREYDAAVDRARTENLSELRSASMEHLRQLGVSGSAVEPAIETSPQWTTLREQVNSAYRERLEEIKRDLLGS